MVAVNYPIIISMTINGGKLNDNYIINATDTLIAVNNNNDTLTSTRSITTNNTKLQWIYYPRQITQNTSQTITITTKSLSTNVSIKSFISFSVQLFGFQKTIKGTNKVGNTDSLILSIQDSRNNISYIFSSDSPLTRRGILYPAKTVISLDTQRVDTFYYKTNKVTTTNTNIPFRVLDDNTIPNQVNDTFSLPPISTFNINIGSVSGKIIRDQVDTMLLSLLGGSNNLTYTLKVSDTLRNINNQSTLYIPNMPINLGNKTLDSFVYIPRGPGIANKNLLFSIVDQYGNEQFAIFTYTYSGNSFNISRVIDIPAFGYGLFRAIDTATIRLTLQSSPGFPLYQYKLKWNTPNSFVSGNSDSLFINSVYMPPNTYVSYTTDNPIQFLPGINAFPTTSINIVVQNSIGDTMVVNNPVPYYITRTRTVQVIAGGNSAGTGLNQLKNPFGLTFDGNGDMIIADQTNNRILRWTPGASNGVVIAGNNGAGSALNQLNAPSGVVIDKRTGILYVADAANKRIIGFPSNSTSVTNGTVLVGTGLTTPTGLVLDGRGYIYVCDQGANQVIRYNIDNPSDQAIVAGLNGGLSSPSKISIDTTTSATQVSLYIADNGNNRIVKWTVGGSTSVGITVAGGNGAGSALNQFNIPASVVLDPIKNSLIISDFNNGRIVEWPIGASQGTVIAGGPNNIALSLTQPILAAPVYKNGIRNIIIVDFGSAAIYQIGGSSF